MIHIEIKGHLYSDCGWPFYLPQSEIDRCLNEAPYYKDTVVIFSSSNPSAASSSRWNHGARSFISVFATKQILDAHFEDIKKRIGHLSKHPIQGIEVRE